MRFSTIQLTERAQNTTHPLPCHTVLMFSNIHVKLYLIFKNVILDSCSKDAIPTFLGWEASVTSAYTFGEQIWGALSKTIVIYMVVRSIELYENDRICDHSCFWETHP